MMEITMQDLIDVTDCITNYNCIKYNCAKCYFSNNTVRCIVLGSIKSHLYNALDIAYGNLDIGDGNHALKNREIEDSMDMFKEWAKEAPCDGTFSDCTANCILYKSKEFKDNNALCSSMCNMFKLINKPTRATGGNGLTPEQWSLWEQRKITVNCRTEEDAKSFIQEAYARGYGWRSKNKSNNNQDPNKICYSYAEKTCYYANENKRLTYGTTEYAYKSGVDVIAWQSSKLTKEQWALWFNDKAYILCKTEDAAKDLFSELKQRGITWVNGKELSEDRTEFNECTPGTGYFYSSKGITYSHDIKDNEWYENYEVLTWEL